MSNLYLANDAKHSAIDGLDKELSKVSLAAGEAKDAASKAVADGKKAVDTTKGKLLGTIQPVTVGI